MKLARLIVLLVCCVSAANAQHVFRVKVTDQLEGAPLAGVTASIKNQVRGVSDEKGLLTITSIPEGEFEIEFNFTGYEKKKVKFTFPLPNPEYVFPIILTHSTKKLREVAVQTTRSNKPFADIPTRMELIQSEEIEARWSLHPADIRLLLNGSTGIYAQQISVSSFNTGVRIYGLDSRYTQMLRDGFPIYSGFANGLSVQQISPIELRQVEIIKGSSSTLYGSGAISGIVNLISKTPEDKQLTVLMNGTSALGLDVGAFYAQKFEKVGATIFAARNSNWAYDPAGISLSAIPEFERYTFNPGLSFYFNDKTQLNVSLNSSFEDRTGGDTKYIKGEGDSTHAYFEKNATERISSQIALRHKLNDKSHISVKNSFGFFQRRLDMPDYRFSGKQFSSFSEVSWNHKTKKLEWILGVNEYTDKFTEDKIENVVPRDYSQFTIGAFAQNTWNVSRWFALETGLRGDYQNDYGFFALPRFSTFFKLSPKVSARIGGGLGYRTPTIFTDAAEMKFYKDVLPVDVSTADAEKSIGGNFDVTYKTSVLDKQGSLCINQLVFYTRINEPVELDTTSAPFEYVKRDGFYDSRGTETNIQLKYRHTTWAVGYTFADSRRHFNGNVSDLPLSAKHRIKALFIYEVKNNFRAGFEAYFTGKQLLSDGSKSDSYWICGILFEKLWKHVSVFANIENILNVRQSKYEKIYTGSLTEPTFKEIYAPLDGVVANVGLKVSL